MDETKIEYAIMKIRTNPITPDENKENVEIYFLDENNEQVKAEPHDIEQWPIEVNSEHKVRYIDSAFWYISNPTCVVWDGRYF